MGLFALMAFMANVKIIPEGKRLLVLRLGRVAGLRGPGLVMLVPIVDKPVCLKVEELIGKRAKVIEEVAPVGLIQVEEWPLPARSNGEAIPQGAFVTVIRLATDNYLEVKRI